MKSFFTKYSKSIVVAIVLAVATSYVSAAVWTPPQGSAPSANVDTPVHTGPAAQVKPGGLSVNAFAAFANAQFEQQAFLKGIVRGGQPGDTNSTVSFGGVDAQGITRTVNMLISGSLSSKDYIQSDTVANPDSKQLCADSSGKIVLCDGSTGTGNTGDNSYLLKPFGSYCDYKDKFGTPALTFAVDDITVGKKAIASYVYSPVVTIQLQPEQSPETRTVSYKYAIEFPNVPSITPLVVGKAVDLSTEPGGTNYSQGPGYPTPTIFDVWGEQLDDRTMNWWNNVKATPGILGQIGSVTYNIGGTSKKYFFRLTTNSPSRVTPDFVNVCYVAQ